MCNHDEQAIHVEDYEEQRRRRIASRYEEDDCIYEQFREEGARMIPESDARLQEVRRQAEEERLRYADQVRLREIKIQRLHRVLHMPIEMPSNRRRLHQQRLKGWPERGHKSFQA